MSTIGGVPLGAIIQGILVGEAYLLRRYTNGPRTADPSGGYERVRRDYSFRGYSQAIKRDRVGGQAVRAGTVVIGCYGSTIEVSPKTDDEVVDSCGGVYVVYHVDADSVGAVHVMYCAEVKP